MKILRTICSSYIIPILLVAGMLTLSSGCSVYFNTFFNAKKAFNNAEKTRKNSKTGRGGEADYKAAIEKARKVVDNHPNSKYYDDALFILGVSYFHTEQYGRAERKFREILANYDDPDLTRQSRLYLAKSKLLLNEIDEGMLIFEEIFSAGFEKEYKAEAAMALGKFQFENEDWKLSRSYFMAVRDSLGDDLQRKEAEMYIADGYYESFQFGNSLGAYLQLLGLDPDKNERYHALEGAAKSSFRLLKIADGIAYLQELIENELYYDSVSVLRLKIAEGFEYEDDLVSAEVVCEEVANTAEKRIHQAEANYRLGLIYQYDYDNLKQAKEYYDKAVSASRVSKWGREALQRSSDIGKIESYQRQLKIDSTTTQEQINEAARAQYQLGELYWFQLNKPDTAILEMQYVVDSFPKAPYAAKAMLALSGMYRDYLEDTTAADSILKTLMSSYPKSDYLPEAFDLLGLRGTAVDTGYAAYYIGKAEDFLVDYQEYDSALYYYKYVADNFEDSRYYLQAVFNQILVTEMYLSPGDSSVYFAYQEFADSFPGTPQASEALNRLNSGTRTPTPRPSRDRDTNSIIDQIVTDSSDTLSDTTSDYIDPREALYIGPNGEKLAELSENPTEIEIEFEFPTEAYSMQEQGFYLYFQILVDFSGKVVDHSLKIPSQYEEVNRLAKLTVQSMTFDPLKVSELISRFELTESADGRGHWLVYKYLVEKPEFLR